MSQSSSESKKSHTPSIPTSAADAGLRPSPRRMVSLGVQRQDVATIAVAGPDLVVQLAKGKRLVIQGAALEAAREPGFVLQLLDVEIVGQDLLAMAVSELAPHGSDLTADVAGQAPVAITLPDAATLSPSGKTSSSGTNWLWGLGALALGGGGGGGGSSGDTNPPNVQPPSPAPEPVQAATVLKGLAMAGPFVARVLYEVFDANARLVASALSDANGKIDLSLPADASGVYLVRISSTNVDGVDYMNEITGKTARLDAPLRAFVQVASGKTNTATITPLTEVAVRTALLEANEQQDANLALPADTALAHNARVAQLFEVSDITGPVVAVISPTGERNPDYIEDDDTNRDAEQYGRVLAALSGSDAVSGSMINTLSELTSVMRSTTKSEIAPNIRAIVSQGVKAFELADNTSDFAKLEVLLASQRVLTAPPNMNAAAGQRDAQFAPFRDGVINLEEVTNGLTMPVPLPGEALKGDDFDLTLSAQGSAKIIVSKRLITLEDAARGYALVKLDQTDLTNTGSGSQNFSVTVRTSSASNPAETPSTVNYLLAPKNFTVDSQAPTVSSIVMADMALKRGQSSTVTITFSEAVTDLSNADITLDTANGSLSTLSSADGGKTWTATYTANADIEDTTNTLAVGAAYTDLAGNAGAGLTSANFTVDTKAPVVSTIVMADTALKRGESSTVTITFSEAVTGLSNTDITLDTANGSLSTLSSTDNITWTATYTANADIEDTTNTLAVGKDYTDLAGNAGRGLTSANFEIDTKLPTVVSVVLDDSTLKKGESATVTITFSEKVKNFDLNDITYDTSSGTLSPLTNPSGDGKTWVSTLTPKTDTQDATNTLAVGTGWTDAADNAPAAGLVSAN